MGGSGRRPGFGSAASLAPRIKTKGNGQAKRERLLYCIRPLVFSKRPLKIISAHWVDSGLKKNLEIISAQWVDSGSAKMVQSCFTPGGNASFIPDDLVANFDFSGSVTFNSAKLKGDIDELFQNLPMNTVRSAVNKMTNFTQNQASKR